MGKSFGMRISHCVKKMYMAFRFKSLCISSITFVACDSRYYICIVSLTHCVSAVDVKCHSVNEWFNRHKNKIILSSGNEMHTSLKVTSACSSLSVGLPLCRKAFSENNSIIC